VSCNRSQVRGLPVQLKQETLYEPGEYFAESFVAYMAERDALAKYDAIGSKMVEQAIVLMRKPK
jgi:hypothetical protein